jgi:hypothetical protein
MHPANDGDYGRACAVDGYLGIIDVGGGEAVVLGDVPAMTTFLPSLNVLVRAIALEDDVDVEAVVYAMLPTARWEEEIEWTVTESAVLFDSVFSNAQISDEEHLIIPLTPGRYAVEAAYVEVPEACLLLVRLTPRPT